MISLFIVIVIDPGKLLHIFYKTHRPTSMPFGM